MCVDVYLCVHCAYTLVYYHRDCTPGPQAALHIVILIREKFGDEATSTYAFSIERKEGSLIPTAKGMEGGKRQGERTETGCQLTP